MRAEKFRPVIPFYQILPNFIQQLLNNQTKTITIMDPVLMHLCALEFLGTLILVLMGDGVCAACNLNKSKAQGAGWVVIAFGWGLAVMSGVFVAHGSGAHLNPAVTIGLAATGGFGTFLATPV